MPFIRTLRLRSLVFFVLLCLGAALIWTGGCRRPRPKVGLDLVAPAVAGAPAHDDEAIIAFRLERDMELSRQRETLTRLLGENPLDDALRAEAEKELWRLAKIEAAEHEAEAVLAMGGWMETAVGVTGDIATVVVRCSTLTEIEAADIGRLVAEVTGLSETAIRIVERQ